jgi:uncharacterized membrane protein
VSATAAPGATESGAGSPGAGRAGAGLHESGSEGGPRFPGLTVQGWFGVVFAVIALLVVIAAVVIAQILAQGRSVSAELDGGVLPAQAQAYRL